MTLITINNGCGGDYTIARVRLSRMVKAAWGQLLFTGSFKGSFSLLGKSEESAKLKLLCSYDVQYFLTSTQFSQVIIWVEISPLCGLFSLLSCECLTVDHCYYYINTSCHLLPRAIMELWLLLLPITVTVDLKQLMANNFLHGTMIAEWTRTKQNTKENFDSTIINTFGNCPFAVKAWDEKVKK